MRNVLRLWRPLCLATTVFTAILLYLLTALPGLGALSFDVQADYLEHLSVAVSTSRSFKGSKPLEPVALPATHGKVTFKMKHGNCNWIQLQLSQGGGTFRLMFECTQTVLIPSVQT